MITTTLRILIADDHDVMREGTRAVIERQLGWEVCGITATGREAVELAFVLEPDVVVMDMTMPELNGLEAAQQSNAASRKRRSLFSLPIKLKNLSQRSSELA